MDNIINYFGVIPGRKSSPTHSRYNNELSVEKDEGISDDDDPTELKLLLELNEQVRSYTDF